VVTGSITSGREVRVDVMASIDDLAAVPLFSSLDDEQLARLPLVPCAERERRRQASRRRCARLLVLFGKEFRKLEAARPEIACRIAEAMQARAGEIAELVS
jgi:hypothetical protein